MMKDKTTYEIMTPESVGWRGVSMVMGKHSGRHAFIHRIEELGFNLSPEQVETAFVEFKELADLKKEVFDEDLEAIVIRIQNAAAESAAETFHLEYYQTVTSLGATPRAIVNLRKGEDLLEGTATGDGPVDAVCNAIRKITGTQSRMVDYRIAAITGGTDAQGNVTLTLEEGPFRTISRVSGPDIIAASAQAYVQALNYMEQKKRPNAKPVVANSQP
jgi:2-isopropylmalate synthase